MTAADLSRNSDNFCYRHPDRVSFVMCQRCLRTICHECQTPGPVGVVCPECMKEQKANRTPAQKKAERRWGRGSVSTSPVRSSTPATFVIIALTVVAFVITLIPNVGPDIQGTLAYNSYALAQPWRLLTVALTHGGIWHLALNMLSLYMIGRVLEPLIGSSRFVALYVIATIGGNAAVSLLAPGTWVVGASGAIFGLMGALVVIARRLGGDITGMLVVLGINFAYGVFVSGISWQAHLGGLIAGGLVGLVYYAFRKRSQLPIQIGLLVVIGLAVTALAYLPYLQAIA